LAFEGFDMNVRRAGLGGTDDNLVDELDNRRFARELF